MIVAVHGNQSSKTDVPVRILAETASEKGYQVLSFDLPEHGERKEEGIPCKVQNCVEELKVILGFVREKWNTVGLFACSLGAYFSLLAYREEEFERCLFLSPVVDMERIIENMMAWFHITSGQLKETESWIPHWTKALLGLLLLYKGKSYCEMEFSHKYPVWQ